MQTALLYRHKSYRAGGYFCTLQVIWSMVSVINKTCEVSSSPPVYKEHSTIQTVTLGLTMRELGEQEGMNLVCFILIRYVYKIIIIIIFIWFHHIWGTVAAGERRTGERPKHGIVWFYFGGLQAECTITVCQSCCNKLTAVLTNASMYSRNCSIQITTGMKLKP